MQSAAFIDQLRTFLAYMQGYAHAAKDDRLEKIVDHFQSAVDDYDRGPCDDQEIEDDDD